MPAPLTVLTCVLGAVAVARCQFNPLAYMPRIPMYMQSPFSPYSMLQKGMDALKFGQSAAPVTAAPVTAAPPPPPPPYGKVTVIEGCMKPSEMQPGTHSRFLGCALKDHVLLMKTNVYKQGNQFEVVETTLDFPAADTKLDFVPNITAIFAYDMDEPDKGGHVKLLSGGLYKSTARFAFKSNDVDRNINFGIKIYGKPLGEHGCLPRGNDVVQSHSSFAGCVLQDHVLLLKTKVSKKALKGRKVETTLTFDGSRLDFVPIITGIFAYDLDGKNVGAFVKVTAGGLKQDRVALTFTASANDRPINFGVKIYGTRAN